MLEALLHPMESNQSSIDNPTDRNTTQTQQLTALNFVISGLVGRRRGIVPSAHLGHSHSPLGSENNGVARQYLDEQPIPTCVSRAANLQL